MYQGPRQKAAELGVSQSPERTCYPFRWPLPGPLLDACRLHSLPRKTCSAVVAYSLDSSPVFDRRRSDRWRGRRPNAAVKASNTRGTSSGRARRSAIVAATMTARPKTRAGSCIQNTVQILPPTTDVATKSRDTKPPDTTKGPRRTPKALRAETKKAPAEGAGATLRAQKCPMPEKSSAASRSSQLQVALPSPVSAICRNPTFVTDYHMWVARTFVTDQYLLR